MSKRTNRAWERVLIRVVWLAVWILVATSGYSGMVGWLKLVTAVCLADGLMLVGQVNRRIFDGEEAETKKGTLNFYSYLLINQLVLYVHSLFYVGATYIILFLIKEALTQTFESIDKDKFEEVLLIPYLLSPYLFELLILFSLKPIKKDDFNADILMHITIWVVIVGMFSLYVAGDGTIWLIELMQDKDGPIVGNETLANKVLAIVGIQLSYDAGVLIFHKVCKSRPIWKKISTEITWASALVGTAIAIGVSYAVSDLTSLFYLEGNFWLEIGIIIGVCATLGHLLIAKLKWLAKGDHILKTYGKYRPGVVLELVAGLLLSSVGLLFIKF